MTTVAQGLQSQIRNIEAEYGRSMDEWVTIIRASHLTKHGGQLMYLAIAGCISNDLFREALGRGIKLSGRPQSKDPS